MANDVSSVKFVTTAVLGPATSSRQSTVAVQGPPGPPGPEGPQGPQGPSGVGMATYVHDQMTPNAVWNIVHNLGRFPSITVVDTAEAVVVGTVEYLSNNAIRVTFTAAFSGRAFLN